MRRRIPLPPLLGVLLGLALAACAPPLRPPITPEAQNAAIIPGIPEARMWGDGDPHVILAQARRDAEQGRAAHRDQAFNLLALSGGGADGAFSAGFMNGWTASGTRPSFAVVTGVSTGALVAPFAFLGPEWDHALEQAYTGEAVANLLQTDGLIFGLLGTALFKAEPLRDLVGSFVTPELLAAVAQGHARGRRLIVVTTNLDAQRPVLWNMGAIASSKRPDRLALFRDVLVASASVPGLFPPVMIKAEAFGRALVEMHVDGGATTPVFTLPDTLPGMIDSLPNAKRAHFYVIINNALVLRPDPVPEATVPVITTAFSTMIRNHTRSVLATTRAVSEEFGMRFGAVWIPEDAVGKTLAAFEPAHMRALFQRGFEMGASGTAWRATLPQGGGGRPLRGGAQP